MAIDPCAEFLRSFDSCLSNDNFFMAIAGHATKYKHSYTGTRIGNTSWVVKCSFNSADKEFQLIDPAANALLLKQECVRSIKEYAFNKLLISLDPKDLLLVDNMQVQCRIEDPDAGNISKD